MPDQPGQRRRGQRLLRRHVAGAGQHHVRFGAVIVARPFPDADAGRAVPDRLVHGEPDFLRLLAGHDHVDQIAAARGRCCDDAHKLHVTVHQPWGTYTNLVEEDGFKIERIVVKPGRAISLQYRNHRAEHRVVVRGEAVVRIGDTERVAVPGQSRHVPKGEKHRLSNRGARLGTRQNTTRRRS
jgi:mannose-6-phosphate isomerase-like protein (cupin superfamily)